MHKLKFVSDDKTISCSITVDNNISKEKLESIFKSLMLHLETSVGLHSNRPIFDMITQMRGEFYSKVLKFLVDENLNKGHVVPSHILQHLSDKDKKHWSCFDED